MVKKMISESKKKPDHFVLAKTDKSNFLIFYNEEDLQCF